jgi:hypothetical protein
MPIAVTPADASRAIAGSLPAPRIRFGMRFRLMFVPGLRAEPVAGSSSADPIAVSHNSIG